MSTTAYLVGVLSIKGEPEYLGCEIFSEPSPTVSNKFTFIIWQVEDKDFDMAHHRLRQWIHTPNCRREWMQRSLMSRD